MQPSAPESHRAVVAPVPDGVDRPQWSVMIPTYDCAAHLRRTLSSVLAQDPGPAHMQIEVVDDCSTNDDPEAVVAELGAGRVSFFRQPVNVGHSRNFATCLQRSRGRLVHLLHGDDWVRPGFYATMERPFAAQPAPGAAFCRYIAADEHDLWQSLGHLIAPAAGILDGWLETIAQGQLLQTPSIVVRREVYEHLGGFDDRLSWTEDWEMWVRIAAHYPVWYDPSPLAVYRVHPASSTGRKARTGETVQDIRRAIEINREHLGALPPERRDRATRIAQRENALGVIRRARRMLSTGDLWAPLVNLREAIRTSREPAVLRRSTELLAAWLATGAVRTVKGEPVRWRT